MEILYHLEYLLMERSSHHLPTILLELMVSLSNQARVPTENQLTQAKLILLIKTQNLLLLESDPMDNRLALDSYQMVKLFIQQPSTLLVQTEEPLHGVVLPTESHYLLVHITLLIRMEILFPLELELMVIPCHLELLQMELLCQSELSTLQALKEKLSHPTLPQTLLLFL
jgi:hypothetical protein